MILEARDLTYSYRKTSSPVLDHVSAAFDEGKFYAIVGASGSGKTTLLALLAGLDVPTQGEILYDGADIRRTGLHRHRREHVALVFQSYNLIDYLTAEENVRLGGACDASVLLAEVGLPAEIARKNVLALSGGQQQRVAIARALASPARVLLADEPTGNLDPKHGEEIFSLFEAINSIGTTVMMATHDELLVDKHPHRVVTLANGRIVRDSTNGGYWLDVPDKN